MKKQHRKWSKTHWNLNHLQSSVYLAPLFKYFWSFQTLNLINPTVQKLAIWQKENNWIDFLLSTWIEVVDWGKLFVPYSFHVINLQNWTTLFWKSFSDREHEALNLKILCSNLYWADRFAFFLLNCEFLGSREFFFACLSVM